MKVLFSNPPWWTGEVVKQGNDIVAYGLGVRAGSRWPSTFYAPIAPDNFRFGSYLPYPFFMGYATTYVQKHTDAKVIFRDSLALRESYRSYEAFLFSELPDYIIIESASPSWPHDITLIRRIHQMLPGVKIIVTGPISTQAAKMLDEPVHAWVSGEYEKGVVRVLNGESGIIPHDLLTLAEMNAAPFPYYDTTIAHRYWDENPKGQLAPHAQVWSSRGCPYKCLAGDTLVNTVEGMIPIRQLVEEGRQEIGVYTYDRSGKRAKISQAVNIRQYGRDKLVRVHFDDGTHTDCTRDHRFLAQVPVPEGRLFECEAGDLIGRRRLIAFLDGLASDRNVVSVDELPGEHDVFCLTVPETGWFYANNVLVANCSFCVWPATMTGNDPDGTKPRSVRQYTPDYMEAYLTELVRKYGFRSIYFDDDTFNLGSKHVERMCAVMRKIGVPWSAMCRADTSRMELWQEMKDSGCFGVKIGFESGNQDVVNNIVNKHLDLDYARKATEEIKRVGLTVHGTFTFGLPGETHEQMQETKRFITSLGLDTHQESGCAEIEGTPLHTQNSTDAGYIRQADGRVKLDMLAATLRGTA